MARATGRSAMFIARTTRPLASLLLGVAVAMVVAIVTGPFASAAA